MLHIGVDTASCVKRPRYSLERPWAGGVVWPLPLGGTAQSARRFSFRFHLFLSASWPRSLVSGSPLRDILVVSVGPLLLVVFSLG